MFTPDGSYNALLLSLISVPYSFPDHSGRKPSSAGSSSLNAGKSARIGELPKGKVGPLAQLVEQRTFNPWVDGSSPSGPTSS